MELLTLLHVVDQGRSHLDELDVDVLEGFGGPGLEVGPPVCAFMEKSRVRRFEERLRAHPVHHLGDGVRAVALFELDNRRTRR